MEIKVYHNGKKLTNKKAKELNLLFTKDELKDIFSL